MMAELMNQGTTNLPAENARITIIASDGLALMDSHTDPAAMSNFTNRLEFIGAISDGTGETVRISEVFGDAAYYYAIRLNNGNVLRISQSLNSLNEVFAAILPALVAVVIIVLLPAHIVARTLTRR